MNTLEHDPVRVTLSRNIAALELRQWGDLFWSTG